LLDTVVALVAVGPALDTAVAVVGAAPALDTAVALVSGDSYQPPPRAL
jgi:hypothetical protein